MTRIRILKVLLPFKRFINTLLMITEEENLLMWWESLDKIWKDIFSIQIRINTTILKIKVSANEELNQKEKILVEIDDDFEKNNSELKKIALKNLIKTEKIIIGRPSEFILQNLIPLSAMKNLKNIRFNNCQINDLKSLENQENLKKIEFHNVKISNNSTSVFSNLKNIEIRFEKVIFI